MAQKQGWRSPLLIRLVLGALWMVLQESYTPATWVAGILVATAALWLFGAPARGLVHLRTGGRLGGLRWVRAALRLTGFFLVELWRSTWAVARLVVRRHPDLHPGVIALDLRAASTGRVTLLSTLITLTPGTLVIGVSPGQDRLYIHCIDARNEAAALHSSRRFEELVMEVVA